MAIPFLLDENLRGGGLWQAIQQHNAQGWNPLDVVRVGDPPDLPLKSLDPAILLWAEKTGRILLSLDKHSMPGHLLAHLKAGHRSPGIFVIRKNCSIPQVLFHLVMVAHAGDPAIYMDTINYIP